MDAVFDHLAVACETLEEGVAAVEAALGVPLEAGGRHAAFATHNRVLSLGDTEYLEVIAVDPEASPPGRPRWFDLDRFSGAPRITNWIVRVPDLASAEGPGTLLALERSPYRWRMAVPDDGVLPFDNLHPAMIEWQGPHPAQSLPDRGVRLTELVLRAPDPSLLKGLPGLGDPRLRCETGPAGIKARFSTPGGELWL